MDLERQYRLTDPPALAAAEERTPWLLRSVDDEVDKEREKWNEIRRAVDNRLWRWRQVWNSA